MALQSRSHLMLRNGILFSNGTTSTHEMRGQMNIVPAFQLTVRANDKLGMDAGLDPYCQRRSEASTMSDDNASNDASLSLPKRHPGREAGPQSTGSLEDCLATEEAPSAEEPSTFLRGGVCNG